MGLKKCGRCEKKYDDKEKTCPHCRKEKERERQEFYRDNREGDNILNTTRWRKLRKVIIDRDGGYCQRCWIKFGVINPTNLQVNHIKSRLHYPDLVWDESNLITVCKTCNTQLGVTDCLDFEWVAPNPNNKEWDF